MWETDGSFGVDSTPSLTNRDFGPEERGQNAFARVFGRTCSCHMWLIRVPEHEPAQYSKKKKWNSPTVIAHCCLRFPDFRLYIFLVKM